MVGIFIARLTNIKASCLKVDKAITFLKSKQNRALPLESKRVKLLIAPNSEIVNSGIQ